jgi:DNA helicase-2/ATP-dependent DNA helicase PcrA
MAREYTITRHATAGPKIDFAAELNEQQYAAVTAAPGPALVIAGAGSGKTRTLVYRVAYLLENGVLPQNILLLTFTNKAAREMLERVSNLIPHDIQGLWGGTFHSIGLRLLRRHVRAAGLASGFSIMDREDQETLLDGVIVTAAGGKDARLPKGAVLGDVLSYALNTGLSIEEVCLQKYLHLLEFADVIEKARREYEERKRAANCVDFDDLLAKPLRLLRDDAGIAEHYQQQFQFILVDEYQDTNHLQADFIEVLAARNRNVMVVGDDAQAIYSWRGADFKNILEFPQRYPEAKVYKIETNYRSVPEILEVANAAIAGNVHQFRKELMSMRKGANKPGLVPVPDSTQQAIFVAQRILDLQGEGIDLREIAVLYRAHFHSMEIQMELTRHGIPFEITSGLRFFEQAHVKDVAAFLKFAVNPRDEVAFKRMVRLLAGVGARSAEQLWEQTNAALAGVALPAEPRNPTGPTSPTSLAGPTGAPPSEQAAPFSFREILLPLKVPAKSRRAWEQLADTMEEIAPGGVPGHPAEMLKSINEAIYDDYARAKFPNYELRREDLNTLMNYARQFETAYDFLDQLALMTNLDSEATAARDDDEKVTLSSVHQAKGLEWKAVFVIWLTEGMFPSSRSLETEAAIEEERRLLYVAITRAKDELYLTFPYMRLNAGYGERMQRPSRFLGEIPPELLEDWNVSVGY